MKPAKQIRAKASRAKTYSITTDREGSLPLSGELMRAAHVRPGDEFAAWTTGKKIVVVFPKRYTGNLKIPKTAQRGKVEPALPDKSRRRAVPHKWLGAAKGMVKHPVSPEPIPATEWKPGSGAGQPHPAAENPRRMSEKELIKRLEAFPKHYPGLTLEETRAAIREGRK